MESKDSYKDGGTSDNQKLSDASLERDPQLEGDQPAPAR
jgi:hypothetical protein